jgi:hypothetical protein
VPAEENDECEALHAGVYDGRLQAAEQQLGRQMKQGYSLRLEDRVNDAEDAARLAGEADVELRGRVGTLEGEASARPPASDVERALTSKANALSVDAELLKLRTSCEARWQQLETSSAKGLSELWLETKRGLAAVWDGMERHSTALKQAQLETKSGLSGAREEIERQSTILEQSQHQTMASLRKLQESQGDLLG